VKPNVFLSGRNIPNVHVMPYSDSSTYHILWSDIVLVEAGAIGTTLDPIAEDAATPVTKRARPAADTATAARKTAKRDAKTAAKAASKSAKKSAAAKKPAAKKSAAKKTTAKKAAKKSTKKKGK
jgi:hypothetical protein